MRNPSSFFLPIRRMKQKGIPKGLLRSSKAIHCEASSVLYGQNVFDFQISNYHNHRNDIVPRFLYHINMVNRLYIRHVLLQFPYPFQTDLQRWGESNYTVIRICNYVKTITLSARSTRTALRALPTNDLTAEIQIWKQANDYIRWCFQRVKEIIVEDWGHNISDDIKIAVEGFGWKIREVDTLGYDIERDLSMIMFYNKQDQEHIEWGEVLVDHRYESWDCGDEDD